jgi:ankyrin repeat protein
VHLLLDRGANVNAQGGHCDSALRAASMSGNIAIVQLLLDKGADINTQGGHALLDAVWQEYEAVIPLLLEKGADLNVQDGQYSIALQMASETGQEGIVRLLRRI